jgi:hypothetical protein
MNAQKPIVHFRLRTNLYEKKHLGIIIFNDLKSEMEYFPFNSLFIDFTETLVHRILNLTKKET